MVPPRSRRRRERPSKPPTAWRRRPTRRPHGADMTSPPASWQACSSAWTGLPSWYQTSLLKTSGFCSQRTDHPHFTGTPSDCQGSDSAPLGRRQRHPPGGRRPKSSRPIRRKARWSYRSSAHQGPGSPAYWLASRGDSTRQQAHRATHPREGTSLPGVVRALLEGLDVPGFDDIRREMDAAKRNIGSLEQAATRLALKIAELVQHGLPTGWRRAANIDPELGRVFATPQSCRRS